MTQKSLNPLTWNIPIADKSGNPTPEFQRKWLQQQAINGAASGVIPGTFGDASHVIKLTVNAKGVITAVTPVVISIAEANLNLADVTTDNVSITKHGFAPKAPNDATKFLDGTGAYSTPAGGAPTLPIKDEGGLLTNTPTSINFVGAGVTATVVGNDVTVTVPGGGSSAICAQLTFTGVTAHFASNFAAKGNVITPDTAMSITGASALITSVTGGTYKFGVAPYDTGTNKITSAPTYSNTFTEAAGATFQPIYASFPTPVALTADTNYIIFCVRTDATSTTSFDFGFVTGPFCSIGIFIPNTGTAFVLASLAPATTDVWSSDGPGLEAVMFTYTLP